MPALPPAGLVGGGRSNGGCGRGPHVLDSHAQVGLCQHCLLLALWVVAALMVAVGEAPMSWTVARSFGHLGHAVLLASDPAGEAVPVLLACDPVGGAVPVLPPAGLVGFGCSHGGCEQGPHVLGSGTQLRPWCWMPRHARWLDGV